jgi:serine/threonine-protein kinase SRPK3
VHHPDPTDVPVHPLKKNKHRKWLRVSSQGRLESDKKYHEELQPLTDEAVHRMQELDLQVKLCDMGNACYIDQHYSDIIQTREYRSPEVIVGGEYDTSADIWSLACMLFELVTGDFLFDPKKGKTYRKNDDHLALITELLGPCTDRNWMERSSKCWSFYDKRHKTGLKLKNIRKLHRWPLYNVLLEKYRLSDPEARSLSSFLEAMLRWKPKDRATARDLLSHRWLAEADEYGVWMSKGQLKEHKIVHHK